MIWLPLKFYLWDFMKKLALATLGGIVMGLFLLGPLADTLKERILFFNWSLTITLYGTFFYTYPLLHVSKWYMNAPVSKMQWFVFNSLLQFAKFILTVGTFVTVLVLEKIYFPAIPIQSGNGFEESLSMGGDVTTREIFKHSLLFAEDFMSSSMLGLLFTLMVLLGSFIFNVDPYGPFRGGIIGATRESTLAALKKWWKEMPRDTVRKWALPFLLGTTACVLLINMLLSKALSFATVNTLALFLVFLTYDRSFTFSNKTRKAVFTGLGIFFVVIWQGIMGYSGWISSKNVSVGLKLQEMEFQGKLFSKNDYARTLDFLHDPTLGEMDFQRLVILAQKSYPAKIVHPFEEQIKFDTLLDHPFDESEVKSSCLKNKKIDGVLKCLNLITSTQMDFPFTNEFFDHLWQLEGKDDIIYHKFVERFSWKKINYTHDQVVQLLVSTNPYKQNLALRLIEERNTPLPLLAKNGWHKHLKEANFPLARQLISKLVCYPVQSLDLALGTFLNSRHPASCMIGQKMRSLTN